MKNSSNDKPPIRPVEIRSLTGLRGIGAVWVFATHFLYSYNIPIIRQGWLAVPMFFVLSGFILYLVHESDFYDSPQLHTLKGFFLSRFARIYPLHLFTMLFLLALVVLLPGFADRYQSERFSLPNFFSTLFLVQTWGIGHFAPFKDASDAWNGPAWSLSAEFAYYLFFPWVAHLFFLAKKRGFSFPPIVVCAFLAFLAYSSPLANGGTFTRYLICGWFSFCLGMSISAYLKNENRLPSSILELAAVLLIVAAFLFEEVNIGLFVLGVATLICSMAQDDSWLGKLFASRIVHFLGKISFSIYLVHWPIIQLFNYVQLNIRIGGIEPRLFQHSLVLVLVGVLSCLTYFYIEVPARHWLRRLNTTALR